MTLRDDCIREALHIIETSGVENLSMREVARRLGVSHQAPYKHFASRDHILAEVVKQAFDSFAAYLDAHAFGHTPQGLAAMGRAYLHYALSHPLQYRLMFGTPLPDPQAHPEMMQSAQHAFNLLRDCIAELSPDATTGHPAELDALFIWSTLHGLASVLHSPAMDTLTLPDALLNAAPEHLLMRIGAAMGLDHTMQPPDDEG